MPNPDVTEAEFDTTFNRYWLPVFRFALAWTNDWAAAEDLTQDAFVRLWTKRTELDWSEPLLPWLLTTTRHLATDRFRRLRTTFRATSRHETASGSMDSDARLRWLDLQPKLADLAPIQRSSLVMTTVLGLPTEEAAEILGISPGAVRAAVSRARRTCGPMSDPVDRLLQEFSEATAAARVARPRLVNPRRPVLATALAASLVVVVAATVAFVVLGTRTSQPPVSATSPAPSASSTAAPPTPDIGAQIYTAQQLADLVGDASYLGQSVLANAAIDTAAYGAAGPCPPPDACEIGELRDVTSPVAVSAAMRDADEGEGVLVQIDYTERWMTNLAVPNGVALGAYVIRADGVQFLGAVTKAPTKLVWSPPELWQTRSRPQATTCIQSWLAGSNTARSLRASTAAGKPEDA